MCQECITQKTSPEGSDGISRCACNAGWSGTPGGTCTECVAGKFKTSVGDVVCTNCPAGRYSTLVGMVTNICSVCPLNSNSLAASDELKDCTCRAGYTGADGIDCSDCIRGKYKINTGSADCTDCVAGTYSTTLKAATASVCQTCPTQKSSVAGSDAISDCTCNPGLTGVTVGGVSKCESCVAGKYKVQSGDMACTNCLPGKFSTNIAATSDVCQCKLGRSGLAACLRRPSAALWPSHSARRKNR